MPTTSLVHDAALVTVLEELRRTKSLPPARSIDDEATFTTFTRDQFDELIAALDLFKAFMEVDERVDDNPRATDADKARWAELWLEVRRSLERLVIAGRLDLDWVQKRVFFFGALPDPKDGYRYYREPTHLMHCWTCGGEVLVIHQACSVMLGRAMPLAGTGQVVHIPRLYCPNCEQRPSDRGIILQPALSPY